MIQFYPLPQPAVMMPTSLPINSYNSGQLSQLNQIESGLSPNQPQYYNQQTSLHRIMNQRSTDSSVSSNTTWTSTNTWTVSNSNSFE